MTFHPEDGSLAIVGLDPAVAIVGTYDEESGAFAGTGSVTLGGGSTIESDVALRFALDPWSWDYGYLLFFTEEGHWTRRHRDPAGTLVCTETYAASGYNSF